MTKALALALFLSLLLNAALLLRKPADPPPPVVRTRVVEKFIAPDPPDEGLPRPSREMTVPLPAPAPALPAVVRPTVTLLATPSFVAPDGEITVTCTLVSGTPSANHWIGLHALQAHVSNHQGYRMISTLPASFTFKAPRKPGEFEFRYILEDNQTSIAASNPIRVLGDPLPKPMVDLQPATTYVKCGAEIPASWSVFSGRRSSQDWIGLYAPDAKNEDYVSWKYVTDTDLGRLTLQAPDKPGTYEIRYLLDNGYESVATSMRIVVVP